ncbi:MAG TPA: IPT/TIG domain-containing protein, partial [Bryobacteraceae bacterium]|nr:IPT/TIG domain-containing protein [Bryobacteraceae bacterium]
TTDLLSAKPVSVQAGQVTGGIDIGLTQLPTLPIYDVSVYSYFNNNTVAVKPGYLNRTAGKATVVASGAGLGSDGQAPGLSAAFMGDSLAVTTNGVRPYAASGYTYIALDVNFLPFGTTGPQHLIINTPGFMHVLPTAVKLTNSDPPTVDSLTDNGDGTLTVTGSNWSSGSAIYFGSLPATVSSIQIDDSAKGTALVRAPAGETGETVVVTVYNADGENSQFVQSGSAPTYTYPDAAAPTITSIDPASLPAGAEARVTITGSGFQFADGQATLGFGTSDVSVRKIFVIDGNHLQADVSVAAGAALSDPDVSVFNGYQTATAVAGFHVTAAVPNLPAPIPILTNALPGLNGSYAGAIVSLYGTNLAATGTTPALTFNGEAAQILYSSPTQINLQIPGDLAPGVCELRLVNSVASSFPLAVNIDNQPADITSIVNTTGGAITAALPASPGDLLTISLTGFAPDGTTISPDRVRVGVNGLMHSALTVQQSAPGVYQVSFLLNSDEPAGDAQTVVVYLDGRSSYPATIPVAASAAAVASLRAGN